jgi:hypothetical protein
MEAMNTEKPFTVGQWIITLLLIYLPPFNLIFLLYRVLSKKGSVNRKFQRRQPDPGRRISSHFSCSIFCSYTR